MAGIETQESILLIEHAVSAFEHQGKNQSDLANFLGVETSRLSEGKKGRWRLMPAQKEKIIQEFGYPKQGKGVYANGEHYLTVAQFIESFLEIGDRRFYQRLSSELRSSKYLEQFLSCIEVRESIKSSNEVKIRLLNEYIDSNDFSDWFEKAKKNNDISNNLTISHAWDNLIRASEDSHQYLIISNYLYRVGLLKFTRDSSYTIGRNKNENLNQVELVLSGSIILDADIAVGTNKQLTSSISVPAQYSKSVFSDPNMLPDCWGRVEFKLFLSESMRYNAMVTFEPSSCYSTNQRQVVIEDLEQITLFQQIEELRKFFGDSFSYENRIKHKIAENGGYVPGARRL
ncbi:hypothetical protein F0236_09010 [Vibrio splendidus]|uniref:hypothetical protein n=1 Tax=Vibrio splendidus TaxID=29497 RepID=UPI00148D0C94|nr:hypothetical protein [Vibrio splendidus]NOJ03891.1 hypothetical protein [Vibrio splendidus]